jgi:hypothetical protein
MNQGNLGFSAERYFRGFSNGFFLKAKRYLRIVHLRIVHLRIVHLRIVHLRFG